MYISKTFRGHRKVIKIFCSSQIKGTIFHIFILVNLKLLKLGGLGKEV